MRILTVDQIQKADQYTIENEPIASLDLMERASQQVVDWISARYSQVHRILILAGSGNNGGDGLAIARLLASQNYLVKVILPMGQSGSKDFEQNLKRIKSVPKVEVVDHFDFSGCNEDSVIIDSVFGSGLSRPIKGAIAHYIRAANNAKGTKIAIDIPSGLFSDKSSPAETIFEANFTLSFQVAKLAFMMPENQKYIGEFTILDIGLSNEFIENCQSDYTIFEKDRKLISLLKVPPIAHKGMRGRATIIAGGYAKMGATILAAKGTLHSGIGLLSVQCCTPCIDLVQNQIPEALILKDENDYALGSFLNYHQQDALIFGPAVGFAKRTIALLEKILKTYKGQLILDADAITILSQHPALIEIIPEGTILTPHPGEFKRLVGEYSDNFEALMQLKSFCMNHKVVMILKGRHTAVCNLDGQISFNTTGNSGMAKGGSGDLLCGMMAGIAPRIKKPYSTAKLAVYLHGMSGDLSLKEEGDNYMTPTTMVAQLKNAFKNLYLE